MSLYLSVYLSVHLLVYMFIRLSVHPSDCLSIRLTVSPSICLSLVCLSICLSSLIYLYVHLSGCTSIQLLSIILSVCLPLCPSIHPFVCLSLLCVSIRLSVSCLSVHPSVCLLSVCLSVVCPLLSINTIVHSLFSPSAISSNLFLHEQTCISVQRSPTYTYNSNYTDTNQPPDIATHSHVTDNLSHRV